MSVWSRLFGRAAAAASPLSARAAVQPGDGGVVIANPAELEAYLRTGAETASGAVVTAEKALRVAAVYRCVSIIADGLAGLPLNVMRQAPDGRTRTVAADHPLHRLLSRQPNRWQTSFEFRRMLQAHKLLRGNAYALVVRSLGRVVALIPLHPDRVTPKQGDDLAIVYEYRRPDGATQRFAQSEILHIRDLSADGLVGLSRLSLMREAIGLSLRAEEFGARMFRQGVKPGAVVRHPGKLSPEARANIKAGWEAYAGSENAHKTVVLEEGMEVSSLGLSPQDTQFLEAREFQRSDIAMFFGVPPHLIGDTQKATSWGTGIEQQTIGFLQFTLQPEFVNWEQALVRDCLSSAESETLYVNFVVQGFLRAAAKDRAEYYTRALGSGGAPAWMTPNEIRALEDMNPIAGGDDLPKPANPAANPAPQPASSQGAQP